MNICHGIDFNIILLQLLKYSKEKLLKKRIEKKRIIKRKTEDEFDKKGIGFGC